MVDPQEIVNTYLGWSLRIEAPIFLVALYLISKPFVAGIRDIFGIQPYSSSMKAAVFIHNVILAVFSGWVMFNCFPIWKIYLTEEWVSEKYFWDNHIGVWAIIFYASKYYEFIDSWILVLKGKEPSFLQVYHHAGVVYTMYCTVIAKGNWIVHLVCLNSFIHTLMYTRYALVTIMKVKFLDTIAPILTKMQITQFFCGIIFSFSTYFNEKVEEPVKTGLFFMHTYALGLIYLFHEMAKAKYKSKKDQKSK